MDQAENIEHLFMTCLKWNKGKDAIDKGDYEGLRKINPSKLPIVDWITILGGATKDKNLLCHGG